jgi:[acyl-carrier-protein] S-malonyltransferase
MTENSTTAFAFPGMGIRLTGFERALFLRHRRKMLPFLEEAGAAATVDLVSLLEREETHDLDDRNSQVFTFAFNSALSDVLQSEGLVPQYAAGYSFGLYAALFATRALPFSDLLSCVCFAFDAMRDACAGSAWGMAAVIGLNLSEIENLLRGSLAVVNVNSTACAIVAGLRSDLGALCARAVERRAIKAELLPVDIPYHLPAVLAGASDKLRDFCNSLPWQRPLFPLVSSVNGSLLTGAHEICEYTARHLSTPISWLTTVERLHALGVTRIIECGPGVSLSRHGSFMAFDISYVNVKNIGRRCGI